jgi:hypothetical protein
MCWSNTCNDFQLIVANGELYPFTIFGSCAKLSTWHPDVQATSSYRMLNGNEVEHVEVMSPSKLDTYKSKVNISKSLFHFNIHLTTHIFVDHPENYLQAKSKLLVYENHLPS